MISKTIIDDIKELGWQFTKETSTRFTVHRISNNRQQLITFDVLPNGRIRQIDNAIKYVFRPTQSHYCSKAVQLKFSNSQSDMAECMRLIEWSGLHRLIVEDKPFMVNPNYHRGPTRGERQVNLNRMYASCKP